MKYVVGIDGGNSKTTTIIGDAYGNILATYNGRGSNHQTVGIEETRRVIKEAIDNVCASASIKPEQLSYIYAGLAGADFEIDFSLLKENLSSIFGKIPFDITNDSWIALYAGAIEGWGAVSINGAGSNAAAIDRKRENTTILRAQHYELGGYGGGDHVMTEGIHFACRADEDTGDKTLLTERIPEELGFKDMEEFVLARYTDKIRLEDLRKITKLVYTLANEGDKVCQDILIKTGEEIGKLLAGCICKLGMQDENVPVVLAGSLYSKTDNLLLTDSLTLSLRRKVPRFNLIVLRDPPVFGAYFESLHRIGVTVNHTTMDNARRTFSM